MKASIERLYHFNCDACQKWWAIADFPWGSQSSMWCPWCGHENTLPDKPMTGDDFINGQTALNPAPGQIYRHYKHNPAAEKWHEYEVIGIVEAGPPTHAAESSYTNATHTETGQVYGLLKSLRSDSELWWCTPGLNDRCVLYRNTKNKTRWLRPLNDFVDGRFELVNA
ncbi:MAG: hypothetical protein AAF810_18275 [Cyanobacteria bacterium P01_D01_bin.36]